MSAGNERRCPECGGDPVSPAGLPWWGRLTGLPLVIACCLLGFCALMAAVHIERGTSSIGGMKAEGLGMTVEEVRQAAEGNDALQRRLAGAILAAGEDFMFTGSAEWRVIAAEGLERTVDEWRLGVPVRWLTRSVVSSSRQVPGLLPMDEWRWFELTLRWTGRGAAGPTTMLLIDFAALAVLLLCVVLLAGVLERAASRRSRRAKAVAWALGGVAALLLVLWPVHSVSQRYGYGAMTQGVTRNRTRILAQEPEGRASIAVTAAAQLAQHGEEEGAVVQWHMPQNSAMEYTGVGWPRRWAGVSVYGAVPEDERAGEDRGLRVQEGIFRWRWFGADGRLRSLAIPAKSVAATLTPVLLLCFGVHWTALVLQGRRERRLVREGRCLRCGYSVG